MYLFFDTETTGLPRKYDAPVTDLSNWPRLVQLAWMLTDSTGNVLEQHNAIIAPIGFAIPPASAKVHGITQKIALEQGQDLTEVLMNFLEDSKKAQYLVGHNVSFDEKIVGAELVRMKLKHEFDTMDSICTKAESTDYCKLPGKYGYKWPTLNELHQKLFKKGFEGAHSALEDAQATARCFFELQKRGVL